MKPTIQEAARFWVARDLPATEAACRALLDHRSDDFDALHLLGVVLSLTDRHAEALPLLRRAHAQRPADAMLRMNLGNALLALKLPEEAVTVSDGPTPPIHNNRGLALMALGRHAEAESAFRRAIALARDYVPAWANLGNALVKLDRLEEALIAYRRVLQTAPPDTPTPRLAATANEAGRTLMMLGRSEEALAECDKFLSRHPGDASVRWNRSLCLLSLGRFAEGWREYECRFDVPEHDFDHTGCEVIDPSNVRGKRVLIVTEQGRGDMIQFIRYAPLLTERGAEVWVQAYPDLVPLLAGMPGIAGVVGTGDPRPAADLVTPVLSLPLAFGTHPANVPYLRVPKGRTSYLGPATKPRIGVVWSGSPHSYDRSAMPASALAPLFALRQFEFHCLQPELVEQDRIWLDSTAAPLTLHTPDDFADTAGLAAVMDRVVSIDTAVAHLAGALAKPVAVMLPFNPDWRWLRDRGDSPWYPTARLFRQPRRGDWSSVVTAAIAWLVS